MALASRTSLHLLIILVGIFSIVAGNAVAAKRVALVIGNSDYQNASSLPNPTNDADAMSRMLNDIGFEVNKLKDVGYNQMRLALRKFASKAASADIALIFYAGHGMEVNKHNYLIPSDATLATDRDIDFETVSLDLVTQAAGGARKLSLVLLDACRNNPFAASMKRTIGTRSIGRGLAKVEPTTGTLISFAAKEGTVAADGNGKNSPYTTALMNHLQQPGLEINILFRKVRDAVLRDTGGNQEPFTYSSLPGDQIYLVEPKKFKKIQPEKKQQKIASKQNPVEADLAKNQLQTSRAERAFALISNSENLSLLNAFVKKYPDSFHASIITARIGELKSRKIKIEADKQKAADQRVANLKNIDKSDWETAKLSNELIKLRNYVSKHPNGEFRFEADLLIQQLNNTIVVEGFEEIKAIQTRLFELNFDPGNIDGKIGKLTREAIKQYQEKYKLPGNGNPTVAVLATLRNQITPGLWGIIALSTKNGKRIVSSGHKTRSAAILQAKQLCQGCDQNITFSGKECAALAISSIGWGWASKQEFHIARDAATALCKQHGKKCFIKAAICTDGSEELVINE